MAFKLAFNKKQEARLEAMRAELELKDKGQVVARALAVYEYFWQRKKDGAKWISESIEILDPKGNE